MENEYKVDFDIPSMKKDQLKEFRSNIIRAVVFLVLTILLIVASVFFFRPLIYASLVPGVIFLYLTVLLAVGGYRYNRYAKKHSVDLVTFTSDTIKIDNDEYKRGDKDISYRIERGLKHDHLNLTGCLLVVSNKKDASRKTYWIGPKKHFDSEFKREMFFDSIYDEKVNCLYLDDVPRSGEKGDIDLTIHFPYKDVILSRLLRSFLMIGFGVGMIFATSQGYSISKHHIQPIRSQGDAVFQNIFGMIFIVAPIVIDLIPIVKANATLKSVRIKKDTIIFNDEYVYPVEGLSIDIYQGSVHQFYIRVGHRVYWAGSANEDESYYSVRCLRNNLRRVCPWVLASERGV